jgi:hypothetical protein
MTTSAGTKKMTEHLDILGLPVRVGMYVVLARHGTIKIGKVIKLSNKMIHVVPVPAIKHINEYLTYSKETAIINSEDALVYVIKHI